jgi:ABC-2 type transport system permease protein
MNGYMVLTRKELRESWRTYRVLIAVAVFAFSGIVGPITTHMMPDLLRSGLGSNAHVHITVEPPTAADAVASYLSNVVQLPMLAVILLAMGAVAEERAQGIGALILYRPVSRAGYLLAKLTAQGAVLLAALVVGACAAFYYITLLFAGASLGPFLALNAGIAAIVVDVLALTLLCSTLLPSGVAAGGAAFTLYLIYSFVPQLWTPLGDLLPGTIVRHASSLLAGTWGGGDLLRPLLGGLVLAVLCIGGAVLALRRQDV